MIVNELATILSNKYEMKFQNGLSAIGISEDGKTIQIQEGSHLSAKTTPSLSMNYIQIRKRLIEKGIVEKIDADTYVFLKAYDFGSFSTAASVLKGVQSNGKVSFVNVLS